MVVSAFEKLGDMVQQRVQENRARKQKEEDEARQNQIKIIMGGIQAHAQNGTLTDDMIKQAQDQMGKLVPKDSIPLIEGWHKVMGLIGRKRQAQRAAGGGQAPGQAAPGGQTIPRDPGMSGPGTPAQLPIPSSGASGDSGGAPQPTPDSGGAPKPVSSSSMYPTATEMGTAAGKQAVAQEQIVRQDRMKSVESAKAYYQAKGEAMPKDEERAMTLWGITGHFPPASFGRTKMHPVTVLGASGEFIPALQVEEGEDTGNVIGPDGKVIDHPTLAPKWKPSRGWAKDAQGKFYSFAIDPNNNQPIKGTEDYTALPPASYLEHFQEGMYYYTDDSGNVHAVPNPKSSGVRVPTTGAAGEAGAPGTGAGASATTSTRPGDPGHQPVKPAATTKTTGAAVPKSMRGPAAKKSDIVGAKDTGVLTPQAQKVVVTTQPVLDQVNKLVSDIDRLGLDNNNDSGYLFWDRVKYKFGKASPAGTLGEDIANLSLGSVVEAASALSGSSRSFQALKKALEHTPNAWVDSPKLIRQKLTDIKARLDDIVKDANTLGRKRQTSPAGPSSSTGAPTGGESQVNPDDEAEKYLQTH